MGQRIEYEGNSCEHGSVSVWQEAHFSIIHNTKYWYINNEIITICYYDGLRCCEGFVITNHSPSPSRPLHTTKVHIKQAYTLWINKSGKFNTTNTKKKIQSNPKQSVKRNNKALEVAKRYAVLIIWKLGNKQMRT